MRDVLDVCIGRLKTIFGLVGSVGTAVLLGRLARCSYRAPLPAGDALRRLGEIEVHLVQWCTLLPMFSNLRGPGPFVQ